MAAFGYWGAFGPKCAFFPLRVELKLQCFFRLKIAGILGEPEMHQNRLLFLTVASLLEGRLEQRSAKQLYRKAQGASLDYAVLWFDLFDFIIFWK